MQDALLLLQQEARVALPLSEQQWQEALLGAFCFVDLGVSLPADSYFEWLGSEADPGLETLRFLALSSDGRSVSLLLKDEAGQGAWHHVEQAATALQTLSTLIDEGEKPPEFAHELGLLQQDGDILVQGDLLLDPEGAKTQTLQAQNPLEPIFESDSAEHIVNAVITPLAFTTGNAYEESVSGARVFVGSDRLLRILPDGSVHFETGQQEAELSVNRLNDASEQNLSHFDLINAGQRFLSGLDRTLFGGQEAQISYVATAEVSGGVRLYYRYHLEGLPVHQAGMPLARPCGWTFRRALSPARS